MSRPCGVTNIKMTPPCLLVALIAIQGALVLGNDITEKLPVIIDQESITTLGDAEFPKSHNDDYHAAKIDFLDMFFGPHSHVFPSSSTAKMAQVTNSDKTAEEQIEDIKEIAHEITMAIQSEMANLLTYAIAHSDKGNPLDTNSIRKRRETPQDSTELVMRLLKHIKANNEYQNIAIEKMMSAQEIADKFGIDFPAPDTDILTDMAKFANTQAKDLTDILKDTVDNSTITEEQFKPTEETVKDDQTYYVFLINEPDYTSQPSYEYQPQVIPERNHNHRNDHQHHHHQPQQHYQQPQQPHQYHHHQELPQHQPIETQVRHPPVQQHHAPPPVTQKPQYYGPAMPMPENDHFPQCLPFEPITTTTTIVIPLEEPVEEPEIVGEEYEETISSKVFIDHENPESATLNHVMTYTIAEKAHFRTPKVEQLPQQMQYYFYL